MEFAITAKQNLLMTPTNVFFALVGFFYRLRSFFVALSLALIIIFGLLVHFIFTKLRLPGLLGMLFVGVILGPYVLNWINPVVLEISSEIRMIALVIILLRAGLGISKKEIQAVGLPAIFLSFVPVIFEGFSILVLSMIFLDFSFLQGGMLGFIIAAVSPAVIVPMMLSLQLNKVGTNKNIPVMILAATSVDDVVAITIFSIFSSVFFAQSVSIPWMILSIPVSVILGVVFGAIIGFILYYIFHKFHIRDTKKSLIILSVAILLVLSEALLKETIYIATLLGVMSMGFTIAHKKPELGVRLSAKFSKMWLFAELFLFVLVGALVDLEVALAAGLIGIVLIVIGLIFRSIGVIVAISKTNLLTKEKWFVVASFLPKATVQAAIGSIPLQLGVPGGEIILAISVLSIVITAPLGATLIDILSKRCLYTIKEDKLD